MRTTAETSSSIEAERAGETENDATAVRANSSAHWIRMNRWIRMSRMTSPAMAWNREARLDATPNYAAEPPTRNLRAQMYPVAFLLRISRYAVARDLRALI